MENIEYEDIKVGDRIFTVYPTGRSAGVALRKENLYENPEDGDETIWCFDGMEYLGSSIGSWMRAGTLYRLEEGEEMPFSERDEWARTLQKAGEVEEA